MTKTLKWLDGDMVRQSSNQGYTFVENQDKAKQDVQLMATSDVRASTNLGCSLDEVVGKDTMQYSQAYTQYPAVFDFQQRLRMGLARLRGAQRSYQYGDRSQGELIFDYTPARVWYDNVDPRNFNWSVDVFTVEGGSFSVSGSSGGN